MKFFLGFVTGIIATIITLFLIYYRTSNEELQGLTLFKQKGECITKRKLKVFQTVKSDMALAQFGVFPNETLMLLVNYDGKAYYDDQKIIIPKNQCARQIGTYVYVTRMGVKKTVPAVLIE